MLTLLQFLKVVLLSLKRQLPLLLDCVIVFISVHTFLTIFFLHPAGYILGCVHLSFCLQNKSQSYQRIFDEIFRKCQE